MKTEISFGGIFILLCLSAKRQVDNLDLGAGI
ncbi:MAG: hypothetical protein ACI9XP_000505 [Lentimonas sp.]|jgi:hypothetical protein